MSVLEAARAVAERVKRGMRPKRTIVFATWDAEEWGLIGSTEYVEDDSLRLLQGAVAYLNQDGAAQGPNFGGGGSPSLGATLRAITRAIDDPSGKGSIYEVWRRTLGVADSEEPAMGDPGGDSDYAGFYNHLGIPHADWGFGGAGGSITRCTTVGDGWKRSVTRATDIMQPRPASARRWRCDSRTLTCYPYDYVEFARTMRRYVPAVDQAIASRKWPVSAGGLAASIARLERSAVAFTAMRDSALSRTMTRQVSLAVNGALLRVERALTRPEGLRTRPWYRNLIYAADENNGYATIVFPSVNEAIHTGDTALTQREIDDLGRRFDAAQLHSTTRHRRSSVRRRPVASSGRTAVGAAIGAACRKRMRRAPRASSRAES